MSSNSTRQPVATLTGSKLPVLVAAWQFWQHYSGLSSTIYTLRVCVRTKWRYINTLPFLSIRCPYVNAGTAVSERQHKTFRYISLRKSTVIGLQRTVPYHQQTIQSVLEREMYLYTI